MNKQDLAQPQRTQKILIILTVQNLKITKKFSSFITIHQSFKNQTNLREVYKSDCEQNMTTFVFKKDFFIDHEFQKTQFLTFKLFVNDKIFGEISNVKLNDIIKGRANNLQFTNQSTQKLGKLILNSQIIGIKDEKKVIDLFVKAKIEGTNVNEKSEYFYKIVRKQLKSNGQYKNVEVYCSENAKATLDNCVQWPTAHILGAKLCLNNYDTKLEVKVYLAGFMFIHTKMGGNQFTINSIHQNQKLQLLNKNFKTGIAFINCKIDEKKSYLHHISDGLQIMSVLCIDFTESNLPHENPKSKHYTSETMLSDYQKVFQSAIDPIMQFDLDKQIPAFGFGAIVDHPKLNSSKLVCNRFPLSMDQKHINFTSLEDLRKSYRQNMKYLTFAGPTKMAPLVKWAVKQCRNILQSKNSYKYILLFILTDGQFCDEQQMKDLVVQCSALPISIVFIGIGDQDFTILQLLDDDQRKLKDSKGNPTLRDCVQFVSFEKFKSNIPQFKKQVLQEVPRQIQEYFNQIQSVQKSKY